VGQLQILCSVTQLFYQPLHIYKFIKFTHKTIKTLKTLQHVSVLGPSSGSYIILAKVTLLKVILISLFQWSIMQQNTERTSVTGHSSQHNTTLHAATIPNWNSEINITFNSVTLARMI